MIPTFRAVFVCLLLAASANAVVCAQPVWERLGGPLLGPVVNVHSTSTGLIYAAGLSDDVYFPNVFVSSDGGHSWEETPLVATDGSAAFASNQAGDVLYATAYRVGGGYDGFAVVVRGKEVLASQIVVPAPYDAASLGNTFFLATAEGVLRSEDGGNSWQEAGLEGRAVYALDAVEVASTDDEPSGRLLASTEEGLFASHDGAQTWGAVPDHPSRLYLMEAMGNQVLAASSEDVWLSRDSGATWAGLNAPFSEVWTLAFHRGEPVAATGPDVWRYDTLRATWTKRSTFPSHVLSLTSTREALLVGAASGIYRGTLGGGFHLTGLPQAAVIRLAAGPSGVLAAAPYGYDVRVSTDGGATWAARPTGSTVTSLAFDSTGTLYAGTFFHGLLYLPPGDSVWQYAGFADEVVNGVELGVGGEVVVVREDFVFARRSAGATWEQVAPTGTALSFTTALAPGGWLYTGGNDGLQRTRLDETETTPLTFSDCNRCSVFEIEVSEKHAFVLANGYLYRCAHTGSQCDLIHAWTSYVADVTIGPHETVAVSLDYGEGVFVSHDQGVTWEELSEGLPLFTGLEGKLPRSMGPVAFDAEGRLLVSVGETGLHRTRLPVVTSIVPEYPTAEGLRTLEVFPNPATGAAVQLRWSHPPQGPVRYTLFDLLGRRVAAGALHEGDAIPVSDLTPGFYVVRAEEENGNSAVARFLVY